MLKELILLYPAKVTDNVLMMLTTLFSLNALRRIDWIWHLPKYNFTLRLTRGIFFMISVLTLQITLNNYSHSLNLY